MKRAALIACVRQQLAPIAGEQVGRADAHRRPIGLQASNAELLSNAGEFRREVPAGAGGLAGNLAVAVDLLARNAGHRRQFIEQVGERGDLARCRTCSLKVADKANADAVLIEEVVRSPRAKEPAGGGLAVRAGYLPAPTVTDEDLTVGIIRPIANHEIVAEAILPAALAAVVAIDGGGRTGLGGGVVDDDDLPAAAVEPRGHERALDWRGGEAGLNRRGRDRGRARRGRRRRRRCAIHPAILVGDGVTGLIRGGRGFEQGFGRGCHEHAVMLRIGVAGGERQSHKHGWDECPAVRSTPLHAKLLGKTGLPTGKTAHHYNRRTRRRPNRRMRIAVAVRGDAP